MALSLKYLFDPLSFSICSNLDKNDTVSGVMDHRKKTINTDAYSCTLRVSFKTTVLNLESMDKNQESMNLIEKIITTLF